MTHSKPIDPVTALAELGIRPYYDRGGATLYHAEEFAILPKLPAESIDALIADPPYCSGAHTKADKARDPREKYCQDGRDRGRPTFGGDTLDQRSFQFWSTLWLREAARVLRPSAFAMVFSDWRQLPAATDTLQAGGFTWRGLIAWDKGRGSRAPHTGYFRHQAEFVAWATKGPCLAAPGRGPFDGVFKATVRQADKLHMTGKPLELLRHLAAATTPGGVILDPFAGSSTTLAAAVLNGRKAIGIEREESYCELSAIRLDRLFDGELYADAETRQAIYAAAKAKPRDLAAAS